MQANLMSIVSNDASIKSSIAADNASIHTAPAFSSLIHDAISNIQSLEDQASSTVEGLMNGSGADIHQAMIATQKANLSFELALAVRNKAVSAYQQVMQMQF